MKMLIGLGGLALLTGVGCDDSREECERARLQVSDAWSHVRESAIKRKHEGVDVDVWATVENKAETLRSAFETQQITWDSAQKSLDYLESKIESLRASDPLLLTTFQNTYSAALDQQNGFASECR